MAFGRLSPQPSEGPGHVARGYEKLRARDLHTSVKNLTARGTTAPVEAVRAVDYARKSAFSASLFCLWQQTSSQHTLPSGTAPRKTLQTVQEMLIDEPQVSLPYLVDCAHGRLRGHRHTCSPSQQRVQRCAKASPHLAGTWRRGGVRTVRVTQNQEPHCTLSSSQLLVRFSSRPPQTDDNPLMEGVITWPCSGQITTEPRLPLLLSKRSNFQRNGRFPGERLARLGLSGGARRRTPRTRSSRPLSAPPCDVVGSFCDSDRHP